MENGKLSVVTTWLFDLSGDNYPADGMLILRSDDIKDFTKNAGYSGSELLQRYSKRYSSI